MSATLSLRYPHPNGFRSFCFLEKQIKLNLGLDDKHKASTACHQGVLKLQQLLGKGHIFTNPRGYGWMDG